jgi:membrane protein
MENATESLLDMHTQLKRGKRLARHVWKHFQEDRCFEEAASLSYTSLLAMVPLMAVVFGIVAAFPVFNDWSDRLQAFIFDNFMPATGKQIVPYINEFLSSISSLTLPGTVMLFVTALLLMVRIEVALNRIWRVDRNRTLINRVVMYWAVLTLGPILIGAAIALSAQKVLAALGLEGGMSPGLQNFMMFFLSWMVFSLFFLLVPNRSVRIKHALIGALLSTILFELAKAGFVAYVSNANYKVIYGALATVPIFLFWLYLVWIVVLFGASLAASLTTFSDFSRYETEWPDRWEFQLAYRLVGHLWTAQREGRALSRTELMELEHQASELQLVRLVSRMRDEQIVSLDEDGACFLTRDLEDMTLGDLYSHGDYFLPLGQADEIPSETSWDDEFVSSLNHIRKNGESAWTRSLRSMYSSATSTAEAS